MMKSLLCNDIHSLAQLSMPIIFTALIQEIGQIATMIYVGGLSSSSFIGAMTLGNMMCNITGYSLAYGMASALDTLISQAYGAKKYQLMGLCAQRALVILTLCSIPVILLWTQVEHILHYALFIPITEARLAGVWSRIISLALWPSLCFEVLRKFLQGQNIVWPIVVATICGTTFNITCNYFMMYHFNGGFTGVAYTWCIAQWFSLIVLIGIIIMRKLYIRYYQGSDHRYIGDGASRHSSDERLEPSISLVHFNSQNAQYRKIDMRNRGDDVNDIVDGGEDEELDSEDNWPPLSMDVFTEWMTFLKLGVPGAASLFIEWGSFELVAGIAGQLGSVPLATHGIYMSTAGLFYMIPQAVAFSTATLVGNALGAAEHGNAKRLVMIGITFDFLYGAVAGSILLFLLRPVWGIMFTNDLNVQSLVFKSMPVMFAYCVVDSTKCVCLNILRSTGRPSVTVLGNLFACFMVMLPLGYFLAIRLRYGIIGLWAAMSTAWLLATFVYLFILMRTDWKEQAIITASQSAGGTDKFEKIRSEMDDSLLL